MKSSYRSFRNSLFRFRNVDTSICSDSPCCSYNWDNCCVKSDTENHQSKVILCIDCHPKHMRCVFVVYQQYRNTEKNKYMYLIVKLYCCFWHRHYTDGQLLRQFHKRWRKKNKRCKRTRRRRKQSELKWQLKPLEKIKWRKSFISDKFIF